MPNIIIHAYNLLRHQVKDVGLTKRSSHWPTLEKHFLQANMACAICGSKTRPNVHHKKPFHLFPELELEPSNLITLCMGPKECHLEAGHLGAFKRYNPNIDDDIKAILQHPERKEAILKKSLDDYYLIVSK